MTTTYNIVPDPNLRNTPYGQERRECSSCQDVLECRVFFKISRQTGGPEIETCRFLCHNCFPEYRMRGYHPLLSGSNKARLAVDVNRDEDQWFNKIEPLEMPARDEVEEASRKNKKRKK
jgi:hypothetical protein